MLKKQTNKQKQKQTKKQTNKQQNKNKNRKTKTKTKTKQKQQLFEPPTNHMDNEYLLPIWQYVNIIYCVEVEIDIHEVFEIALFHVFKK